MAKHVGGLAASTGCLSRSLACPAVSSGTWKGNGLAVGAACVNNEEAVACVALGCGRSVDAAISGSGSAVCCSSTDVSFSF